MNYKAQHQEHSLYDPFFELTVQRVIGKVTGLTPVHLPESEATQHDENWSRSLIEDMKDEK